MPSCRYYRLRWLLQEVQLILLDPPSIDRWPTCDKKRIYCIVKFFLFQNIGWLQLPMLASLPLNEEI